MHRDSLASRESNRYFRGFEARDSDPNRLARDRDHYQVRYYHKHPI
ncbi:MAG: hypothetical protein JW839_18830 [Candidatus Lokiarchaeota archaeon]|nr:hypothetical protein [Candidatus Lokiarchaeota archaeon]